MDTERWHDMATHEGVPLVRTSTRTSFALCQQQWEWAWVMGLESNDPSTPLRFGSLAHECMEHWYVPGTKRGTHPAVTWHAGYEAAVDEMGAMGMMIDDSWEDAYEIGLHLMEDYVEHYGDELWLDVIASEQPFELLILDEAGDPLCIYCGTFDGLAYDLEQKNYVCLEHKTAAAIDKAHLNLDEQANTYWALAEYWLRDNYDEKAELHHILYNFMRKGKRDDRPTDAAGRALNKDGSVSKKQPPPRFDRERVFRGPDERAKVLERIRRQVNSMGVYLDGELDHFKSPGRHCNWCAFRDTCEVEESNGDWEEMLDMTTQFWEPFSVHQANLEGRDLDQLTVVQL